MTPCTLKIKSQGKDYPGALIRHIPSIWHNAPLTVELVLAADHVHSALRDLADAQWQAALPALLEDMQLLLRDALDLLRELGEADERSDRSHCSPTGVWPMPAMYTGLM